jgi:hypothetical protein
LHSEIFSPLDTEVAKLFSDIVNVLGSKTVIDGSTKEDGVWKIIDYFTRLSHKSPLFDVLREQDIA